MPENKYTNRFKARLALEALQGGKTPVELSEKHQVPVSLVNHWTNLLKSRAEILFVGDGSGKVDSIDAASLESEKLKAYISLLRATLEATVNGILVIDTDGRIVTYNRRFLDMWRLPENVMAQGEDDKAIRHVLDQLKDPEQFQQRVREVYDHPEETTHDVLHFKDGRVFERYSYPQRLGDEIVGRVWSFMDVTEQREAEARMNRLGRLLKSINANVEEGILRSTPGEGLIYVNEAFLNIFGYESREEALSVPPEHYYADPDHRWELVKKLEQDKRLTNEEVKFRRKDGSTFWGLENSTLVEGGGELYIDAVINDITERKKVEEALRQSEEKYRTILENIEDGYFETDLKGRLTFFNRALQRVVGYPGEQLIGMDSSEYMDAKNARKVYQVFNKVYRTGEPERGFEWEIINKDGDRKTVEASISLKKNSEGVSTGFRGIMRDITARKKHEEEINRSLKEKEILLGEIHHRVKNNLAVISGLLYLQSQKTEDATAQTLLTQSQSRIHSMAMIHEMLYDTRSFANIQPDVYINKLISYISKNLFPGSKNIRTEVTTGDIELVMSVAIPCALIINELLTNAYKYAFEGRDEGTIRVDFTREGDTYRLEVWDNGIGFAEKPVLNRETGEGLGLFLVDTLVSQLDGTLDLEIDQGSRFIITFPAE